MKKILVMMVFVFGMMLSEVGVVKADDCPTGFDQTIEIIELFDCYYVVGICYKCSLTTPPIVQILHANLQDTECEPTGNPQYGELLLAVEEIIFSNEYIFNNLCGSLGEAPPCDDEEDIRTFITRRAFCWAEDSDGIQVCDTNNYCETEWQICWDENLGYQIIALSSTQVGSDSCSSPCFSVGTTKCP